MTEHRVILKGGPHHGDELVLHDAADRIHRPGLRASGRGYRIGEGYPLFHADLKTDTYERTEIDDDGRIVFEWVP